jgi:methionyl aminopeptidase
MSEDEKNIGNTEKELAEGEDEVNICTTPGCGKVALMACPTCNKLGLPPSPFCGQECFKGYWATHKLCHKVKVDPLTIPNNFRYFEFTGPLRPAQQSPRRTVPPDIPLTDYANHPAGVSESERNDKRANTSIKVYNEKELAGIRKACIIGREVLDAAGAAVAVGVTTDETTLLGLRANSSTSSIDKVSILLYTYKHLIYFRLPSSISIKSSTPASSLKRISQLWIL